MKFLTSESESAKEPNKYEALLENLEKINPELKERLLRMSRPAQQTSTRDKKYQSARRRGTLSQAQKTKSPKRNSIVKL